MVILVLIDLIMLQFQHFYQKGETCFAKKEKVCEACNSICHTQHEEFGAVHIFLSIGQCSKVTIIISKCNRDPKAYSEKVIMNVIKYWNSQTMESLYIQQGVNTTVLSCRLNQQISKYQEAQSARLAHESLMIDVTMTCNGNND